MVAQAAQFRRAPEHSYKISDGAVLVIRQWRHDGASYLDLGKIFGLHPKVVQRICVGRSRKNVGGPLADRKPEPPQPVRCPGCGGRVILPCVLCAVRAECLPA